MDKLHRDEWLIGLTSWGVQDGNYVRRPQRGVERASAAATGGLASLTAAEGSGQSR